MIPYFLGLQAIAPHVEAVPPAGVLIVGTLLRNLFVLGLAAGLGLWLARRIGLGAPYLEHRLCSL